MKTDFHSFLDKKGRDAKKQLKIVKEILSKHGLKVQDFLEGDEDPYIYVQNNQGGSSFGGVRVYKIGDMIAYRTQKQPKTYPYGNAYTLKINDMYNDLVSDDTKEEEAGKQVIESVAKEIKKFFEVSLKADREAQKKMMTDPTDPLNRVLITTTGTDYSNNLGN